MRIAFFVDSFPVLSETFILNQITGLIDRGHHVRIFAASRPNDTLYHAIVAKYHLLERTVYYNDRPSNRIARLFMGAGFFFRHALRHPVIMFNAINFFRYGKEALSLNILFKASRILNAGKFDIFQCHFAHNGELAVGMRELGFRAKIITMFHGYDLRRILAHEEPLFPKLWAKGDLFLSISHYTTSQMEKAGITPNRIIYHPVGVDLNECAVYRAEGQHHSGLRIITVARLVKEKNLESAIDTVRILVKEKNFHYVSYRIVGDGPLMERLKQYAKRVEGYISFGGAMTNQAVLEELSHADIFLLTSDAEVLPIALMEAQACQLPAVVTDVGAVREIVGDGLSGFVIPAGDNAAIVEKLVFLIRQVQIR
jgi:colanic acid/amylovoran biosynthesis glycosyltransferase